MERGVEWERRRERIGRRVRGGPMDKSDTQNFGKGGR